ncbi:T9SS type A sorting domain-containing protein [Hyunsoonleella pacifica]|uniref:T9SS type A sorting domain-containing protein n=1 Tax=Hyunsoonleella pacifica TaxID=1080224 RepID=A0A4Q9FIC4_9FLAO|nr:T9SS type A sorting domain-containing protein [Hyunsoonleella pacifica]TBN13063.1 T9SS type A sorting domain-containing protein [Hyunsoonleella pacifica]GGD27437.1 hypothetical protein GCM10011368_31840 [Hyunsoonleella pacifica]
MRYLLSFSAVLLFQFQTINSQVVLDADGPGNTYELINSVLAPGFDVIEVPDCNHAAFGRHIDEVFDSDLNSNVFRFNIHVTPDNDRCKNFDRQRNEIKAYDKSPDNLKGIEGENVIYKWKFKLDAGFQSSPNFTHIHQLKSVGGSLESMPMYTLTTRKGNPDQLELRYAETDRQITLKKMDLAPFKGVWLEVTETINYATDGIYSIEIKRVSDGVELFSYSNSSIINWRPGAEFVRPKWGIYRSLINAADLRDEQVLFSGFSIEETGALSVDDFNFKKKVIKVLPNPAKSQILINEAVANSFSEIYVYNSLGQFIKEIKPISKTMDISDFNPGMYFIVFNKGAFTVGVERLIVK